jgi:hypothetical protein
MPYAPQRVKGLDDDDDDDDDTEWNRAFREKLTSSHLVMKSPEFYGTQSFMTAFTCARHLSLS